MTVKLLDACSMKTQGLMGITFQTDAVKDATNYVTRKWSLLYTLYPLYTKSHNSGSCKMDTQLICYECTARVSVQRFSWLRELQFILYVELQWPAPQINMRRVSRAISQAVPFTESLGKRWYRNPLVLASKTRAEGKTSVLGTNSEQVVTAYFM
jgi:hypothetical protein